MVLAYTKRGSPSSDPTLALTKLVRETLALGANWGVSVMQAACACPAPGCANVETQIQLAPPQGARRRLLVAKSAGEITAEDLRAACARSDIDRALED